jgi:ribosome-associated toxin RatA of RatAB toxin-antitoxin module
MPAFEHTIEIHAEPAALFALTQDYARRLAWDPFLKEARLLGDVEEAALGTRAWCAAKSGWGMETEYISFQAPEVAAVKMTRGPVLLERFAGTWRFREVAPGVTRVLFRYHLQARPRWLRPVLNPILMAVFSRDTVKRLQALKHAVEVEHIVDVPSPPNQDS